MLLLSLHFFFSLHLSLTSLFPLLDIVCAIYKIGQDLSLDIPLMRH
jgi:hypothetical protein